MDMVERVARALSKADGMHPEAVSNDEYQTPIWTLYVDDARAAIEAMREPSPEMAAAGLAEQAGIWSTNDVWTAMIDAALTPSPMEREK